MKLKFVRNLIIVLCFIIFAGGIGYRLGQQNQLSSKENINLSDLVLNKDSSIGREVDFDLFWQVWDALEQKYYDQDKLSSQKMVYGAIEGMVASLKDPWTVFLPPQDNKRAKEDLNGEFEGVGIQLGYKNEQLAVIAPLKGLPAEKQGVKAGDLIIKIKDSAKGIEVSSAEVTIYEAVDYIRGPKGTEVELTLLHDNETEPYTIAIKRETITVSSVELLVGGIKDNRFEESAEGDVAVLKLNRFGDNTLAEWTEAVGQISQQYESGKIKGMVLDLRNNPGGYLSGAVSLASEFVDKGVVVKQENYDGTVETYSVNRKGILQDIPLTILINKGSASASEILAGALRYHKQALIVGEQSFGKGTVQEALELEENAGLHITIAKWLLPDGNWLNDGEGIKPDIEVENSAEDDTIDLQLVRAVEEL